MQAYKAQRCTDGMLGFGTIHGSVHSKLSGGKVVDLPIVMDSGCSKDIISEDTMRTLGPKVTKLERPLNIISAQVIKLILLVQPLYSGNLR